jgi:hypothetical protein
MTNAAQFESFKAAIGALAAELPGSKPAVFRDSDSTWSAMVEADGFTVTLSGSAGLDAVGVLVDHRNEAATGETRVRDIVLSGSDVIEGLCARVGVTL